MRLVENCVSWKCTCCLSGGQCSPSPGEAQSHCTTLELSDAAASTKTSLGQKARVLSPQRAATPFSGASVFRMGEKMGSLELSMPQDLVLPLQQMPLRVNQIPPQLPREGLQGAPQMMLASCFLSQVPRGWGASVSPPGAGSPGSHSSFPCASSTAFSVREEQG